MSQPVAKQSEDHRRSVVPAQLGGLPAPNGGFRDNSWFQLIVGIVAMVAIANLQYGWTLFVDPIDAQFHWGRPSIQWAFTLFVLAETWPMPLVGYVVDRSGPRVIGVVGGLLIAAGWGLNAQAQSLAALYVGGALAGIGAGIVYATCVGNALKWFPHRRGLAAGLTAAAFGAGSALTVVPISNAIGSYGYAAAFLWCGAIQGAVVAACALLLSVPPSNRSAANAAQGSDGALARALAAGAAAAPVQSPEPYEPAALASESLGATERDLTTREMVRKPIFWLMYSMFTLMATGGLMVTAQLASLAKDYEVAESPITFFGFTMGALPLALSLDRVLNGLTRPFFGWVSDHIGRERTMFVAFTLEGLAICLLIRFASVPIMFVLLTGLTFFAWGEIYSLFPALSGDLFGRRFATTNYGLLYTAKGTASLLVPFASYLQQATGRWTTVFVCAIAFDWIAALLAIFVLKPMADRMRASAGTDVAQR
jgi:OFA family oxalate/formate antiporter-like MFS transporter